MRKWLLLLCISINVFFNSNTYSECPLKPITVGVIDSGFGYDERGVGAKLCQFGHRNFTKDQRIFEKADTHTAVPLDLEGHGTNIVGIIESIATPAHANYCIVILKYYSSSRDSSGWQNLDATIAAFKWATDLKLDFVNYSSGGRDPSTEEKAAVERYLNQGGTLVVAAGNNGEDLDKAHNEYYPAEYDKRIIVVGMLERDGVKSEISNYGSMVNRWEIGRNVVGYGIMQSGTSQATATATGKLVAGYNRCNNVDTRYKSAPKKETR